MGNAVIFAEFFAAVTVEFPELFAIVLEHQESATTGGAAPPDLEMVVNTQFLQMSAYIQGLINNPPPAVN
jgi:hypothetical protein